MPFHKGYSRLRPKPTEAESEAEKVLREFEEGRYGSKVPPKPEPKPAPKPEPDELEKEVEADKRRRDRLKRLGGS